MTRPAGLWRSLRELIPPDDDHAPTRTSPSLLYTAVVLASLLAMLEINLHRAELQSMGLVGNEDPVGLTFTGP